MKRKDIRDLNNKTVPELEKTAGDLRGQIGRLVLDLKSRRMKNVNAVKNMRRDLARILTVLNSKEANGGV